MKNNQKTFLIILITVIFILAFTVLKSPNSVQKEQNDQPNLEQQNPVKPACMDQSKLNTWFQKRIDEEAAWQQVNYRFYFTAKRMAADPWIEHQKIINLEPRGGIEGIKAYNQSDECKLELVQQKLDLWDQWHRARMLSLDIIKGAYPKIKEAG